MSLGLPIELPLGDGRVCVIVPFDFTENEQFVNNLKKRLLAVSRLVDDEDFSEDRDPNYQCVNAVIVPLIDVIEADPDAAVKQTKEFCSYTFDMAGQFWKTLELALRGKLKCEYREYRQNLERLFELHKRYKIHPLTPGYEQYIARLNHLMLFEDPVLNASNYAMLADDFMVN